MSKKLKKHGYAERLKYMHMLENGYTIAYINRNFGIGHDLLGQLWVRYQSEGPSGLLKYIRYYNNDRIKLRLNGKSPVQYRALFQSKSAS